MPEGMSLPRVVAAPAKVAVSDPGPAAGNAPVEGGDSGPSFDNVLQAQRAAQKSADPADSPKTSDAPSDATLPVPPAQSPAPLDAALLLQQTAIAGNLPAVPASPGGSGILQALTAAQDRSAGTVASGVARAADRVIPDVSAVTPGGAASLAATPSFEAALGAIGARPAPTSPLIAAESPAISTDPVPAMVAPRGGEAPGVMMPVSGPGQAGTEVPVRASVSVPISAPGWQEAFADRITISVQNRHSSVELQINPPNLGPVDIRLTMDGDHASLSFFSPHAPVREAIQSAMDHLTDALADAGISLGSVSVGAESQSGRNPSGDQGASRAARIATLQSVAAGSAATTGEVRWSQPVSRLHAVDLFA